MRIYTFPVDVENGAVPTAVIESDAPEPGPALIVIPSIFGPAPDLLKRLSEFAGHALVVVPDPFWRVGDGVVPYEDFETARKRLKRFDIARCNADLDSVLDWATEQSNGQVVGLGICFGGPFVLRFASEGRLAGCVTWHGSRMQNYLEHAADIMCPLRFHFGELDPVTPPEAIEAIRDAFAFHPDISIAIHSGATHGYSHDGPEFDEAACRAGLDATAELINVLS